MQKSRYIQIVRYSAWYDLLVTWPFALPWTFTWLYVKLSIFTNAFKLHGSVPILDATHILFANLLGSVVIVWSLARISSPSVQQGRLDAVARILFSTWQIFAVLSGASSVILFFTVFEMIFGILQIWPVNFSGDDQRSLMAGIND